jgi:hypothetical protein
MATTHDFAAEFPHINTHFYSIYPYLPPTLQAKINSLVSAADENKAILNDLIKFCYTGPSKGDVLSDDFKGTKRALENGGEGIASSVSSHLTISKKPRVSSPLKDMLDADDAPLYTIHAISITSPIRKKADITVHKKTIRFSNPATDALEAFLSLDALETAFLVDTPAKAKPHHTVMILPKHTGEEDKKLKEKTGIVDQIIFGVDATSALRITAYPDEPTNHPKSTSTRALLRAFLSHLPHSIPVLEPSPEAFLSADKRPQIDAYLRAKDGHLYFFDSGILFGEKKPCEWFPVEQIAGVRTLTATGRTFSLIIRRLTEESEDEADNTAMGDEMEGLGSETQFSLIEGKESDPVNEWIHRHQNRFGKATAAPATEAPAAEPARINKGKGKALPQDIEVDEEDSEEDEDFEPSGSDSEPGEEFDSNHESSSDNGDPDEKEASGGDSGDESEEVEWVERHPLQRPGAVPKMSKAAMQMAVGMVEEEFGMSSSSRNQAQNHEDDELDEDL